MYPATSSGPIVMTAKALRVAANPNRWTDAAKSFTVTARAQIPATIISRIDRTTVTNQ